MTPRERWFLVLVVVAAFALRAWGTPFGLPFTYHPDEHQYVDTALDVLGGEIDPGRFNNPTLFKYALAAVDAAWFAAARLTGAVASVAEFRVRAALDPTDAYRLARLVAALAGALTVAATYAVGRRAYGRRVGAAAAVLLAGAYLHARESHFAVSDVPAALLTTLALLACVYIAGGGRRRDYVLAGLCIGAATATKYSSLAVAGSLLVAHLVSRSPRHRRLALAGVAGAAVFLLAVPYAVLRWPAFQADLALLAERGRTGFKGLALSPVPGWQYYLDALAWGLGWPLLAASLVGVAVALWRHRATDLTLVAFPIALYVYLAPQLLLFERFLVPALPVLAVLTAAWLIPTSEALAARARRGADPAARARHGTAPAARRRANGGRTVAAGPAQPADASHRLGEGVAITSARLGPTMAVLAVAALLAPPLVDTLRFDWLLTRIDTRTQARQWIEANIPGGTKLMVHSNGPELTGGDETAPDSTRVYDLTEMGTTGLVDRPLDEYAAEGFEYLVLSSFSYERHLLDPAADDAHRAYYAELENRLPLVREFRPYPAGDAPPFRFAQVYGPATDLWRYDRPGPVVKIYRLPR